MKKVSRVLSLCLAMALLFSALPAGVASAQEAFAHSKLSVVTDKASTLAPGVTQNAYTVYDKNGSQVKMFVTTADMSEDSVKLFASYKDMNPTDYGMSKLTEQVAAFDKKAAAGDSYYRGTVVAGINASYYNMTTGKPSGPFVMNGVDVTTGTDANTGYFAVMKDGSVKIGKPGDYATDKGNIQEAIGIHTMLIIDGKICSGLDATNKYPRQTIGITADGKVILMTADGNQAPATVGLTIQEQAEVMLDLGCVWAGHLDGGGSATYACKPEGSNDFVITSSPSDGSERSVSNGFIIVSTAVASYEFDHVLYDVESAYVTPGTSIKVAASGVSSTGHAAELPEGITYKTVGGTYADGVFTASSAAGKATVTAMYNGKAVGSVTVNVVVPDTITFNNSVMTVPFGKTVTIGMVATYGINEVKMNDDDVTFTFTHPAVGTVDGFTFTAAAEGVAVTSSEVVASLKLDSTVTATASLNLGKGSEVIFDFEDGTTGGILFTEPAGTKYNYVWPESDQAVVDSTTGRVHSGQKALSMQVNYANSLESGYMKTSVVAPQTRVFENAVRIGTWLYIPDECVGLWARWTLTSVSGYNADGTPIWGTGITGQEMDTTAGGTGVVYTFDEPGWHYLSIDTSAYSAVGWKSGQAIMQFYISDRDGSAYGYFASEQSNIPGKFQFYMDDVTVDYSSAVDDREAPIFSSVTYATAGMADAAALNGQTITANTVTFGVGVVDNTSKSNYTGLDVSSIAAYIDGVKVAHTYANGLISVSDVSLTNGRHTVKFTACDNMGNYSSVYRYITVNAASSESTVYLAPRDATQDRLFLGSIYELDLKATAIEEVQSVEVRIDLDNNSTWQLDHMVPAAGFTAEYKVEEAENIASIVLTRTGTNTQSGEAVLVTFPLRVWTLKTGYVYPNGTKAGQPAYTLAQFKSLQEFWKMSVIATVDMGQLIRVDDSIATFTGERVFCDTEMWGNYAAMTATPADTAYFNAWNGGHVHTPAAMEDKAADCLSDGYTGRTFCAGCNSVVEWGTLQAATGHSYKEVNGLLQCSCGEKLNGKHTDGKTYVDGALANGWQGDSHYTDGVQLTGVQQVDGYYYNFGETGVCTGKTKYTGLFYDDSVKAYRFSKIGVLAGGWNQIDGNWHYFKQYTKVAVSGEFEVDGVLFQFNEQGMTTGAWHTTEAGTRYYYGPTYYKARAAGYMTLFEVDGKTYNADLSGYLTYGVQALRDSTSYKKYVFDFGDDGVLQAKLTKPGFMTLADGVYFVNQEGYVPMNAGLIKWNGAYYYIVASGRIKMDGYQTVTADKANGLMAPGTYYFGADGKMKVANAEPFTGIGDDGYYYVDGAIKGNLGLIDIEGDYYFICYSGLVKKGANQTITEANANGLVKPGVYYFEADGKMKQPKSTFTGIGADGYYYVNGSVKRNAGLIDIDGDYYFICYSGLVKKGANQTVTEANANGLVKPGVYYFEADGKMKKPKSTFTGIGADGYYYENGSIKGNLGLIDIEGDYFFICYSGLVKKGAYQTVAEANANGLVKPGVYYFEADGKMKQPKSTFTGIGADGYYYENGSIKGNLGLIQIGDDYYFVCYSGLIKKDASQFITQFTANGLVQPGTYYFDADGKMIQ